MTAQVAEASLTVTTAASPAPCVSNCVTVTSLPLVVAVRPSPTKSMLLTSVVKFVPSSFTVILAATLDSPLPAPTTKPNEPVDVYEPLIAPENSKPDVNELSPPLPPEARLADVKCPPPTSITPNEPVDVDEPLISPLLVT